MGSRGKLITRGSGATAGADIYELPNDDSQPFSPYYHVKTLKIHARLPADGWSMMHYRKRGLVPGFPPGYVGDMIEVEDVVEGSNNMNAELLQLMKQMQQEIKELKNQVAANRGEAPPEGPVQLTLL